jgi:hypothetical protein
MYRGVALAFADAPIAAARPDTSRFSSTLIAGTVRTLS